MRHRVNVGKLYYRRSICAAMIPWETWRMNSCVSRQTILSDINVLSLDHPEIEI